MLHLPGRRCSPQPGGDPLRDAAAVLTSASRGRPRRPAAGQDEAPVNLPPLARRSAQGPRSPRSTHGRSALPRRPRPAAAGEGRKEDGRGGGGKAATELGREGEGTGAGSAGGGGGRRGGADACPAPVASPAGTSDSPSWRALPPPPRPPLPGALPPPSPRRHRAAPSAPPSPSAAEQPLQEPGATGQGGAERSDPPASLLRPPCPPAAVTHLFAPTAPLPSRRRSRRSPPTPSPPAERRSRDRAPRAAGEGGSRRAASSMGEEQEGPR